MCNFFFVEVQATYTDDFEDIYIIVTTSAMVRLGCFLQIMESQDHLL